MASRRPNAPQEKVALEQTVVPPADAPSDVTPAVPRHIITKLLAFSAALFILPIVSFFTTRNVIFKGNAAYAGGFAAFVANAVLVAYVIVAFLDDKQEQAEIDAEKKKQR